MLKFLNDEKVKTHNIFMNFNKTLGLYLIQNNKKVKEIFLVGGLILLLKLYLRTLILEFYLNRFLNMMQFIFQELHYLYMIIKVMKKFYKILKSLKAKKYKNLFRFQCKVK